MKLTFDLYKTPEWKLKQLIKHYEDVMNESHDSILKIEKILQNRHNIARHRARMQEYGIQYALICKNKPLRGLIDKIMIDLSCEEKYALQVAEIAKKIYLKEQKLKRNQKIVTMAEFMPISKIAEIENLSRQSIHTILKKA